MGIGTQPRVADPVEFQALPTSAQRRVTSGPVMDAVTASPISSTACAMRAGWLQPWCGRGVQTEGGQTGSPRRVSKSRISVSRAISAGVVSSAGALKCSLAAS